ncbi:MAG: DUF6029 family protein [Saprospiraceae bacterium]|nr:DUF6029 family protein [Saprospiraceae bacterium]
MSIVPRFILIFIAWLSVSLLQSQEDAYLSGFLQVAGNFFLEDEKIGATNTPQYDHQLFGAESWLDLNYRVKGFDVGVRFDLFQHSNLLNPTGSYTDQGIGRWYITKSVGRFHFGAGYLFDQIGSGIIFRAYEERPLLIDNALYGVMLRFQIHENWQLKGLLGKQKNLFSSYNSSLKAIQLEGFISLGSQGGISLVPGMGMVMRTWSDDQVNQLINTLRNYTPTDSIGLYYNAYALTVFNTLSIGPASLYTEAAFKRSDVYFDPDGARSLYNGTSTLGRFRNDEGSVFYGSLSIGTKGLGITVEYKRTQDFDFRADPFALLNRGLINYLPPMSRINSYRLKGRYTPSTQSLSEKALQMEIRYGLSKTWKLVQYFSDIRSLSGELLYREFDNEITYRKSSSFQLVFGIQTQQYNQTIFEGKSGVPIVKTVVPYLEWFKRFRKSQSLKVEAQYMNSEQDFGSWIFGLVEFSIAPKWSFTLSDMYNIVAEKTDDLHYPRVDIVLSQKANRYALSYVKQVEGVICAGGICRLEPAFSGFKLSLTSTF